MKTKIKEILKETLTSNYDNGNIEDGGIGGGDDAIDQLYDLFKTESVTSMKEIVDALNKKFHEYCNLMQDYEKAMEAINKVPFVPTKQAIINDLRTERDKADTKMKEYYQAVLALRKVCTHTHPNGFCSFETAGENLEVCAICGFELRRNKE